MEHNSQSELMEDRPLQRIGQTISTDFDAMKSQAKNYEEQIEAFVRERPVAAVIGALGFGFIVARIFSRR